MILFTMAISSLFEDVFSRIIHSKNISAFSSCLQDQHTEDHVKEKDQIFPCGRGLK